MTWSYSGNPASSQKDAVRFLIGDTDTTRQLATDEEIAWSLTEQPNTYQAAALVCLSLASKFSKSGTVKVGDVTCSGTELAAQFTQRARELERKAAAQAALPFVGGRSLQGKADLREDPDSTQPSFAIGQDDHPDTSGNQDQNDPRLW